MAPYGAPMPPNQGNAPYGGANNSGNPFPPKNTVYPEGMTSEQLRELRALALSPSKKVKPVAYKDADVFFKRDQGLPLGINRISIYGLLCSFLWLFYNSLFKQGFILWALWIIPYSISIYFQESIFYIIGSLAALIGAILCCVWGPLWQYENVGKRINKIWEKAGRNYDQAYELLKKNRTKSESWIAILILSILILVLVSPSK
jgi:hypothetical protein